MSARAVLLVALALLAFPTPAGNADGERSATAYYVGSGDLLTASLLGANVGGANFLPNLGERSVVVHAVDDQVGHRVTLTACQDTNLDGLCGDASAGEPGATGCGGVTLSASDPRPFDPALEVTVFVHGAGFLFVGGCPTLQTATSGYLTAVFQ